MQVDYELRLKNGTVQKKQATVAFYENRLTVAGHLFGTERGRDTEWEVTEIADLTK